MAYNAVSKRETQQERINFAGLHVFSMLGSGMMCYSCATKCRNSPSAVVDFGESEVLGIIKRSVVNHLVLGSVIVIGVVQAHSAHAGGVVELSIKHKARVLKEYASSVLTPDDVSKIDLSILKPGDAYDLIDPETGTIFRNVFKEKVGELYRFEPQAISDEGDVRTRGYFLSTKGGEMVETTSVVGAITKFSPHKCSYDVGECSYTITQVDEFGRASEPRGRVVETRFEDGVWYSTIKPADKSSRADPVTAQVIYDQNGFPLYSYAVSGFFNILHMRPVPAKDEMAK